MGIMNIEFVDGKSGKYDAEIDYQNRVIDILDKGERIGLIPFEAVLGVGFEAEKGDIRG